MNKIKDEDKDKCEAKRLNLYKDSLIKEYKKIDVSINLEVRCLHINYNNNQYIFYIAENYPSDNFFIVEHNNVFRKYDHEFFIPKQFGKVVNFNEILKKPRVNILTLPLIQYKYAQNKIFMDRLNNIINKYHPKCVMLLDEAIDPYGYYYNKTEVGRNTVIPKDEMEHFTKRMRQYTNIQYNLSERDTYSILTYVWNVNKVEFYKTHNHIEINDILQGKNIKVNKKHFIIAAMFYDKEYWTNPKNIYKNEIILPEGLRKLFDNTEYEPNPRVEWTKEQDISTKDLTGGSKFYAKYIKYKSKYIKLKQNLT